MMSYLDRVARSLHQQSPLGNTLVTDYTYIAHTAEVGTQSYLQLIRQTVARIICLLDLTHQHTRGEDG